MKIPTLVGLSLLIIAILLGMVLFKLNQRSSEQTHLIYTPKNIQVVNVNSSQATIIWQTTTKTTGSILWGTTNSLGTSQDDDRDSSTKEARLTHFVTIKNLTADTNYFFKIKVENFTYPDQTMQFKTPKKKLNSISANKPLSGTILDSRLQPTDEALILFSVNQSAPIVTFTTAGGNFLLPLSPLFSNDFKEQLDLPEQGSATLTAFKGTLSSQVIIALPLVSQTLPPIILGQNLDLSNPSPNPGQSNPFDLNEDGAVNSLDFSTVVDNLGKNPKQKNADLNQDGIVDQKDIELIKQYLRQ